MKRYNLISLFALLAFTLLLPSYALREPARLVRAQQVLRKEQLEEGAITYVRYCARCHGASGEGQGAMPALSHPALAGAEPSLLFRIIARASHGATMSAWHIEEGGLLNDYKIQELVTLIRYADWSQVNDTALALEFTPPPEPASEMGISYMEQEGGADPHQCSSCHEEPAMHAGQFGINCARCHTTTAWAPAQLTRHNFALDHGGQGTVDCLTCHTASYAEHTCYECHDHTPEQMQQVHLAENLPDYAACIECHPTGAQGEAERLMNTSISLSQEAQP